ncbi:DUF418 domain-containing protein [Bradyrhizobium sp. GCM10027634]|uniref:DUF418 domain-containing protein n=1 Tax=unclassified Bradyrhizobium TaxID=2631580 RepID=UPI00188D49C0|nr:MULTISPECIES: DUF418 domain-containing protein [unclassified Bradyrhizobium]MDN4999691.1 DUF418 domain-containing protein [Bradyrhizobium sp. WYCCWR 12677]QOZ43401.1 DUF418 domain-containing protein [Bradyrhizobium sp. CCBAU 53340]
MTSDSAASPRPTNPSDRIETIDVLRGIALFGVMAINVVMEFRVSIFEQFLGPKTLTSPIDHTVETILTQAIELKAFALFSLLFGAGLAIQFDRLAKSGRRAVLLVRRLAALLLFGIIHLCLIWNGDILTEYALAGFIVLPLLFGSRWLIALAALASLTLYLAIQDFPPEGLFPSRSVIWRDVLDANRIYATGGFLDVLAFRLREIPLIASLHAFVFLRTIGLFLLGALAWRSGIVQNIRGLFVIALPAVALGAGLLYGGSEPLGTILLALGYGAAILGIASFERGKKLLGWAAPLGRMAFTNYVAQSVIFGWIFYGYGLGLFGRLGITAALAIGIVVYIAQVLFSAWWLRRYRYGPLEWLWRSLMYGVRQPMAVAEVAVRTQLSSRTSEAQIRDP